jgi:octaprenyl-diphosphate synthase
LTAAAFQSDSISPDLMREIREQVALVERELESQMESRVELVQKVGRHTLQAGGKRLRPAFVALAARATGTPCESERLVRLGACMEMIHMATLIHDDVIDHAETRRGRPTASAVFGNTGSILAGDVLLARAMVILAQDGDLEIIRNVSEAVVEMAEGEVRELEARGDFDLTEEAHLEVLRMKTAALMQSCCEIGALAAGASPVEVGALRAYGYHVGMAFQIVDDLLDYRGDLAKTGKPRATDFREGCATLPLIYLREALDFEESAFARRSFGSVESEEELGTISGWMAAKGAYERSEQMAQWHVAEARQALAALPASAERDVLEAVVELVLRREG